MPLSENSNLLRNIETPHKQISTLYSFYNSSFHALYIRSLECADLSYSDRGNMNTHDTATTPRNEEEYKALLTVYSEICKSYQAVDDFRTKLLGFLPLTSLVGIFILNPTSMPSLQNIISNELLGFAAIFAALLTLALFGYEVRGIRRSHHLITEGMHIEKQLGINHGQFHVCANEHRDVQKSSNIFNSKFLACIIYSVVFAAWLFLALRLGWGLTTFTCYIYAIIAGLLLALVVSRLVANLIPS